jgi:predicted nucleotidyltransferase
MTHAETLFRADALSGVCCRFRVQRLDLFGSAATGNGFDPARSDLDFLVAFEPLSPIDYAHNFFGLREALEELSGRPVDLITDAALENPHLRRRVEMERRTLFQAP